MKGRIVDLAEIRASTDNIGTELEKVCAQDLDELIDAGLVRAGRDYRVKGSWYRFPSLFLQDVDDLRRLKKTLVVFQASQL